MINRITLNPVTYVHDLLYLLFPDVCAGCKSPLLRQENTICLKCAANLPRTLMETEEDNPIIKLFWGRCLVEKGCAVYTYNKGGLLQRLIYELKYKQNHFVGDKLGKLAAHILLENNFTQDIDVLIPVPLHPKKEKIRGYNQSEMICKGLSEVSSIAYETKYLSRSVHTGSQTKKDSMSRWENVAKIFAVHHAQELEGKHILLVDDVITTGATMEACIHQLKKIDGCRVSVFALGSSAGI